MATSFFDLVSSGSPGLVGANFGADEVVQLLQAAADLMPFDLAAEMTEHFGSPSHFGEATSWSELVGTSGAGGLGHDGAAAHEFGYAGAHGLDVEFGSGSGEAHHDLWDSAHVAAPNFGQPDAFHDTHHGATDHHDEIDDDGWAHHDLFDDGFGLSHDATHGGSVHHDGGLHDGGLHDGLHDDALGFEQHGHDSVDDGHHDGGHHPHFD